MNDRIYELAEQAGFYFYNVRDIGGPSLGEIVEADSWTAIDNLVHTIVNECADFVEQDQGSGEELSGRLKRHFGIE